MMAFKFDNPCSTPPEQCRVSIGVCVFEGRPLAGEEESEYAMLVKALQSQDWIKDNGLKVGTSIGSERSGVVEMNGERILG